MLKLQDKIKELLSSHYSVKYSKFREPQLMLKLKY